jgi:hypothetical protein
MTIIPAAVIAECDENLCGTNLTAARAGGAVHAAPEGSV